jgi:hypothetical protein
MYSVFNTGVDQKYISGKFPILLYLDEKICLFRESQREQADFSTYSLHGWGNKSWKIGIQITS